MLPRLAALAFAGVLAAADELAEARGLWRSGEADRAIAVLREHLARHPQDAEAAGTLGQYLGLHGDTTAGEALVRQAIASEPGNPDHHLRLAMVLRRAGRGDEALAAADRACELAPDSDEAQGLRDQLRPAQRPWRLDAGMSGDRYSARRDAENEAFASLARSVASGVAIVVGVNLQHRYGEDDQRYDLSLYGPLGPSGSGWIRAGVAPGNHFLPDHEEEAAGEHPLWWSRWSAGMRLTHRAFPGEDIFVPRPSLRWDLHDRVGAEVACRWALSDAQPTTRTAEARLHLNDGGRFAGSIGYSNGDENNPPLPIGRVEVISASLSWQVSRLWGLRLDASHEIREDLYTRNGLGLSATLRF